MKRSCLFLFAWMALIQQTLVAQNNVTSLLITKARAQEALGRLDLSVKTWEQILVMDANQQDALAGLARAAKLNGNEVDARRYLDRLRQINPANPALSQVEHITSSKFQNVRLQEASRLAQSRQYEQAMAIYREVFGTNPPPGDLGIAYYETEAATPGGWEKATAALRQIYAQNGDSMQYRLSLGRLLTYRAPSRAEGMRLLEGVTGSSANQAQLAWRQALIWEDGSYASSASLRAYLGKYPDSQMQALLRKAEKQSAAGKGLAVGPDLQRAYQAMKANKLAEAETEFRQALIRFPKSSGALAGLGYIAMQNKDFAEALKYFIQAREQLPQSKEIQEAEASARYWLLMQDATKAIKEQRSPDAEALFRKALQLRPDSAEALQGAAGALIQRGEIADAIPVLERLTQVQPNDSGAWRSLVNAYYQKSGAQAALAAIRREPVAVGTKLNSDAEYLALLASIYRDTGNPAESRKAFEQAVATIRTQRIDVSSGLQLELAGLYVQHAAPLDAAAAYQRILDQEPENLSAWEGYLAALNNAKAYARAARSLEQLPATIRSSASTRPGFLRSVAATYLGMGGLGTAEALLVRSRELEIASGMRPSFYTELQLAQLLLEKREYERATESMAELTKTYPDNREAWKGLLLALHKSQRDQEAADLPGRVSAEVSDRLHEDKDYLSLMASVYGELGRDDESMQVLRQCVSRYQAAGEKIPTELLVQLGWLLLKTDGNQRELMLLLRDARARTDSTLDQRNAVSELLSTWILRNAQAAVNAGDAERGNAILEAGLRVLPSEQKLRRARAGYFLAQGDSRRALALYRNAGLKDATAADYVAAAGTALAERETELADSWMTEGLKRYPNDSELLNIAGRQAVAKGDFRKAQVFWRAALQAIQKEQQHQAVSNSHDILPNSSAFGPPVSETGTISDELSTLLLDNGSITARSKAERPVDRSTARLPWLLDQYVSPQKPALPIDSAPKPGNFTPSPSVKPNSNVVLDPLDNRNTGGVVESAISAKDIMELMTARKPQALEPRRDWLNSPLFPSGAGPASRPAGTSANVGGSALEFPDVAWGNSAGGSLSSFEPTGNSKSGGPVSTVPVTMTSPAAENRAAKEIAYSNGGLQAPAGELDTLPSEKQNDDYETGVASGPQILAGSFINETFARARARVLESLSGKVSIQSVREKKNVVLRVLVRYEDSTADQIIAYMRGEGSKPTIIVTENGREHQIKPDTFRHQRVVLALKRADGLLSPTNALPEASRHTFNSAAVNPLAGAVTPNPGLLRSRQTDQPGDWVEQSLAGRSGERPLLAQQSPPPNLQRQPQAGTPGPAFPLSGGSQSTKQRDLLTEGLQAPALAGPSFADPNDAAVKRKSIERQLEVMEARNTPYAGISDFVQTRSGQLGFERMFVQESDLEVSTITSNQIRLSLIGKSISLNTPAPDGQSLLRFGLLPVGSTFEAPSVSGLGAEVQLSNTNFGLRFGSTPRNFPVRNYTAGLRLRPGGGPVTLLYEREPVKDTILSYAGVRDPVTQRVWGGVIADKGSVAGNWGNEKSGAYFGIGYQHLTGQQVPTNQRVDGTLGMYWRLIATPVGSLTVGANLFAMHYNKNLRYFTLGQGGYFSPSRFVLFGLPVTWSGKWNHLEYTAGATIGSQSFTEESSAYFPLQTAIQGVSGPFYPRYSSSGTNFNVDFRTAYQLSPNWYIGGFFNTNNANFYTLSALGVTVRYSFKPRPIDAGFNVPSLPDYRGRQPFGLP